MKKPTITEKELRKAWTVQGLSKAQQDAKLAQFDITPAGPQTVLPGAERATGATMAQRKADAPLRPKANQRPCDAGLFSDEKNQTSLF